MHIGLALPQFDRSTAGHHLLGWATVRERAELAERLGFESLWVADQVMLDATGADRRRRVGGYDPLVALGALARITHRVRLGALLLAALRPAAVLAKALATLDVVSGGRLVVGLGPAGPQSGLLGPAGNAAQLGEVCQVLAGMFGGGPFSFAGAHVEVTDARCLPLPVQRPHPPIWLGGCDDDLFLDVVARHGDGWNPAGAWTPDAYRQCLTTFDAACARVGRDPTTVTRSLGLTTLVGESGADLERRFRRLRDVAPAEAPGSSTFDEWRRGRLVGTVDEVKAQLEEWAALGVDTVVLEAGGGGFSVTEPDDMAMLAASCSLKPVWVSAPLN